MISAYKIFYGNWQLPRMIDVLLCMKMQIIKMRKRNIRPFEIWIRIYHKNSQTLFLLCSRFFIAYHWKIAINQTFQLMEQRIDYKMIGCIKVSAQYHTMPLSTDPLIQQVGICWKQTSSFLTSKVILVMMTLGKSWTKFKTNIR